MSQHEQDILIFLLELLALLTSSRLLGALFRSFHQPAVVGELIAGILIGPSFLGHFAPEFHAWLFPAPAAAAAGKEAAYALPAALDGFSVLSATLLMLAAGLEVDLSLIFRQKKQTFYCALFGSVVPLIVGVAAGWLLQGAGSNEGESSRFSFALVLGINFAMSALPVIAKTLLDLGIYKTKIGTIILSAAMIDDLGVWILFSFAVSLRQGSPGHGGSPVTTMLLTAALLIGWLTLGRAVVNRILPRVQGRSSSPGGLVAFTVVAGLAMAALAMRIGLHPVFGSLLAGVAIGSSPNLRAASKEIVCEFILSVFAPIFFATIGLRMSFVASFDFQIVAGVFILGCFGKIMGAGIGARLGGLPWRESCAVAIGLCSRGIMGIVLGLVALEYGIIDQRMFVALAILGIGTSLLSGPLLRLTLGRGYFSQPSPSAGSHASEPAASAQSHGNKS